MHLKIELKKLMINVFRIKMATKLLQDLSARGYKNIDENLFFGHCQNQNKDPSLLSLKDAEKILIDVSWSYLSIDLINDLPITSDRSQATDKRRETIRGKQRREFYQNTPRSADHS